MGVDQAPQLLDRRAVGEQLLTRGGAHPRLGRKQDGQRGLEIGCCFHPVNRSWATDIRW
ncbi:MAG: hypothetical protein HIU86_06515 [Acidobacteria bacterium]|nr:hypothetical protein [Acidobacteriota bacterium]